MDGDAAISAGWGFALAGIAVAELARRTRERVPYADPGLVVVARTLLVSVLASIPLEHFGHMPAGPTLAMYGAMAAAVAWGLRRRRPGWRLTVLAALVLQLLLEAAYRLAGAPTGGPTYVLYIAIGDVLLAGQWAAVAIPCVALLRGQRRRRHGRSP